MAHSESPSMRGTSSSPNNHGTKSMRPQPKSPPGLLSRACGTVETFFSYIWLVIQLLLLLAGLTVLNFATLMVVLSYVILGRFIKPRQEFFKNFDFIKSE